jgi:hypothetical protein
MSCTTLLQGLRLSKEILSGSRISSSLETHQEDVEDCSEGDTLESHSPAMSAPVTIQRQRIGSKSEMAFEEQIALQESIGLSMSPMTAGFGLGKMVARMFQRGPIAVSSDKIDKSSSGGSSPHAAHALGLPYDQVVERNAKAHAELLYDSPFVELSSWLLRKRHRRLNADMCSLDWLTCEGEIDFEQKTLLMKVCQNILFLRDCFVIACLCFASWMPQVLLQ